jgi:hypothetical protein
MWTEGNDVLSFLLDRPYAFFSNRSTIDTSEDTPGGALASFRETCGAAFLFSLSPCRHFYDSTRAGRPSGFTGRRNATTTGSERNNGRKDQLRMQCFRWRAAIIGVTTPIWSRLW